MRNYIPMDEVSFTSEAERRAYVFQHPKTKFVAEYKFSDRAMRMRYISLHAYIPDSEKGYIGGEHQLDVRGFVLGELDGAEALAWERFLREGRCGVSPKLLGEKLRHSYDASRVKQEADLAKYRQEREEMERIEQEAQAKRQAKIDAEEAEFKAASNPFGALAALFNK